MKDLTRYSRERVIVSMLAALEKHGILPAWKLSFHAETMKNLAARVIEDLSEKHFLRRVPAEEAINTYHMPARYAGKYFAITSLGLEYLHIMQKLMEMLAPRQKQN